MTTALLRISVGSALVAALLQLPEPVRGAGQASRFDRDLLRPDSDDSPSSGPAGHTEFYFTRAAYTGYWGRNWAIDYPKADRQLMVGVRRLLTHLDASPEEHPVRLDDPDLNRYPFLYAVEVGRMALTEPEVAGLRRYLQAGAFPERAPYPRLEGKLDHILPPSTKRIDRGRELRKRRTASIADHLVTHPGEAAVAMQQRVGEQTMAERVGEVGVPIAVRL